MSDSTRTRTAREIVLERATFDARFREQLRSDPRGAIRECLGLELTDDVEVVVVAEGDEIVEENEERVVLSLPPLAAEELTDDALDAVAGGFRFGSYYRLASTRIRRISAIRFSSFAFSAT